MSKLMAPGEQLRSSPPTAESGESQSNFFVIAFRFRQPNEILAANSAFRAAVNDQIGIEPPELSGSPVSALPTNR